LISIELVDGFNSPQTYPSRDPIRRRNRLNGVCDRKIDRAVVLAITALPALSTTIALRVIAVAPKYVE
jgi:hypothetical protein